MNRAKPQPCKSLTRGLKSRSPETPSTYPSFLNRHRRNKLLSWLEVEQRKIISLWNLFHRTWNDRYRAIGGDHCIPCNCTAAILMEHQRAQWRHRRGTATGNRFLHVVMWHSSDPTPTPIPTLRDVTNQAGYVAEKRCHDNERWRYRRRTVVTTTILGGYSSNPHPPMPRIENGKNTVWRLNKNDLYPYMYLLHMIFRNFFQHLIPYMVYHPPIRGGNSGYRTLGWVGSGRCM